MTGTNQTVYIDTMQYADFVASVTPRDYYLPLDSGTKDILHAIIGISTEAGELLDIVKKQYAYNRPFSMVNFIEELGDVLWYMQLGINAYNRLGREQFPVDWQDMTLQSIIEVNVKKLMKRYPENKFTEEHALNRDLEQEREVLEEATNEINQIG